MKLFVRNIPIKENSVKQKVDLLDLSDYKYAEIYKVEVSIDTKANEALFYNITSEQQILSTKFVGGLPQRIDFITIPKGYYHILIFVVIL